MRHRGHGADEERPARPQDDRRTQQQLDPVRRLLPDQVVKIKEVAAHLEREDGQRQHGADPQAPSHVAQFGARSVALRGDHGLQRHAADRTVAGAQLAHLGMHRAGVLDLALALVALGRRLRPWRPRMGVVGVAAKLALHHRAVGHHVRCMGRAGGGRVGRHRFLMMHMTCAVPGGVLVLISVRRGHGLFLLSFAVSTLPCLEGQAFPVDAVGMWTSERRNAGAGDGS